MGRQWKQCQTLFLGALKSLQMGTAAMKLKDTYFEKINKVEEPLDSLRKKKGEESNQQN